MNARTLLLVFAVLLGGTTPAHMPTLSVPAAHADDELESGDVFLGVLGRSAIVGATTTMFLAVGAGAGLGLAYLVCPSLQCPRYNPGARPNPDAPIDPMMLGAGATMGAALGGGLGAYMSGALIILAFE
jgi:hypothetical protein